MISSHATIDVLFHCGLHLKHTLYDSKYIYMYYYSLPLVQLKTSDVRPLLDTLLMQVQGSGLTHPSTALAH